MVGFWLLFGVVNPPASHILLGDAMVCVSEAPILVPRAGSAGNGGKAGGGCSGGLAPLPELPVPPLLS